MAQFTVLTVRNFSVYLNFRRKSKWIFMSFRFSSPSAPTTTIYRTISQPISSLSICCVVLVVAAICWFRSSFFCFFTVYQARCFFVAFRFVVASDSDGNFQFAYCWRENEGKTVESERSCERASVREQKTERGRVWVDEMESKRPKQSTNKMK